MSEENSSVTHAPPFPRPCPVCGWPSTAGSALGELDVNHQGAKNLEVETYQLTACRGCELIFISPLPSNKDIHSMYAQTVQFTDPANYRGEAAANVLEFIATRLTSMLRLQDLQLTDPLRVLEVGAGLAWMCRAAKILDWGHTTVAQDLTDEVAAECRWVDHYIVEDVMESESVERLGPYDVISLTHVFEHLQYPVEMLERLAQCLSPNGLIFITAPQRPENWCEQTEFEVWRQWSYNHTPAHIQYFNEPSFARAAAAANLSVKFWDGSHEGGQAFEGWLGHK